MWERYFLHLLSEDTYFYTFHRMHDLCLVPNVLNSEKGK